MIETILEFFHVLTNSDQLLNLLTNVFSGFWAYAFIFAILFTETGLLVGFVLPGDSLLFTLGVVAGAGGLNLWLMDIVLFAAVLIGDFSGYSIGKKIGAKAFNKPDSVYFKREYLEKTKTFYEKHGGKTIIYAKFIPIIRTFAPFIAGVGQMKFRDFLIYDIFGAAGWIIIMTLLGYGLGNVPIVKNNFEKAILLIIFISLIPPVFEAYKAWRFKKTT